MDDVVLAEVELEKLKDVYVEMLDMGELGVYFLIVLLLFFMYYLLTSFMLSRWSERYIERYDLNLSLFDFLIPVWKNVIYLKMLKNHNLKLYKKFYRILITLILICVINPYLFFIINIFFLYLQGKLFKVYLLNKNYIYLHYFSLGLFTPYILWKER